MWWRRRRALRDLEQDIRDHIEQETDDLIARGMSRDDASRQAHVRFGSVALAREDARATWGWLWLEQIAHDLRFAVRLIRRRPVLSMAVILTLGLGIGGATATFSLLDALLVRSLPVHAPGQLVQLVEPRPDSTALRDAFTLETHDRLRPAARTLSGVLATSSSPRPRDVDVDGERRSAVVEYVSDNYFDVLGVGASRGQVFHAPGPSLSGPPVAVISADHWRTAYAASPSAIGSRFRLPGSPEITVIGVAAAGFRGVDLDVPVDAWILADQWVPPGDDSRVRSRWMRILGRLEDDVSMDEASVEAAGLLGRSVRFQPGGTGYSGLRRTLYEPLLLVGLAVASVLLVVCANVANLMLAGTIARGHELALRVAIGATRLRVFRQLLTEGLVLALLGGLLGMATAWWISGALLAYLPPEQAQVLPNLRFVVDARVLTFTLLLTLGSAITFCVAPTFRPTGHVDPMALRARGQAGDPWRGWLSRGLVVGQVVLCTVTLIVAGVFLRTLQNLRSQDAGYREAGLVVADVRPLGTDEDVRDRRIEALRERIAGLPGVEAVAFSNGGQLEGSSIEWTIGFPGRPPIGEPVSVIEQRISPGFLEVMGNPVIAGREFVSSDDVRAPLVAVVNESFARRFLPDRDPVGARFFREGGTFGGEPMEIVGVVRDSKWHNLREEPPAMYYRPYGQMGGSPRVRFVIRSSDDSEVVLNEVRVATAAVARDVVVENVVPFREIVDRTLVIERLVAQVSGAFGVLALVIAAIGLYAVLAYQVSRRRREIGVRIALGARPGLVEWMFVRQSSVLVLLGMLLGVPVALAVTRLSASMLFGLQPHDPASIGVALVILTVTVTVAGWIPARRAAQVDPVVALREE